MTAKQKKLFLLTSMMSVFVMAVAVLFTGGKISMSPFVVRGSGEVVNGTITWTTSNSTKTGSGKKVTFLNHTSRGTGIYLYSYGMDNQSGDKIISTKKDSTGISGLDYGLFVSSEAGTDSSLFSFQNITSVSVTTKSTTQNGASFALYTSNGGSAVATQSVTGAGTFTFTTEVAGAQSILLKPTSTGYWLDITSFSVSYTCETGGGGVPSEKTLSSISVSGQTTEFTVGDTFVFGGTVTANYSDSTSSDVTSSSTFSGYDMSESGEQTVTVSYTEGGVNKTTSYSISVTSSDPSAITLSGRYNFTSRQVVTDGSTNWISMYIEFNSNGTAVWYNSRTRYSRLVQCTVYLLYSVTDDGSKYNISIEKDMSQGIHTVKGYSFYDGDSPWDSATAWTGYGTDKPLDKGFTAAGTKNDTGELTLDKNTLKFSVFDSSHSYEVNSIFTFTLAS